MKEKDRKLKLVHSSRFVVNEMKHLFNTKDIIELKEKGYTNAQIAEKFGIPEPAVFKVVNLCYSLNT